MIAGSLAPRLPIYPLLRPFCAGREVLHLGTPGPALALLAGGAEGSPSARIVVAEGRPRYGPSKERRLVCEPTALPLAARSLDVVLLVSTDEVGVQGSDGLSRLCAEVQRVLRPEGFFALLLDNPEGFAPLSSKGQGPGIDYWDLQGALKERFAQSAFLALAPTKGVYVSYLEPLREAAHLSLRDELLTGDEPTSHYLALASARSLPELDAYSLVSLPAEASLTADHEELLAARRALSAARREGLGAQRELADLRRRLDKLHQRAEQGEQALTELVLERDRLEVERQRAAGAEGRLAEQLEEQWERRRVLAEALERHERERRGHRAKVEELELHLADAEGILGAQRERIAVLGRERDELRELLQAEQERRHRESRERARLEQQAETLDEASQALSAAEERVSALEEALGTKRQELSSRLQSEREQAAEVERLQGERRELFSALREERQARGAAEEAAEEGRRDHEERQRELLTRLEEASAELAERAREKDRLLDTRQHEELHRQELEGLSAELAMLQEVLAQRQEAAGAAQEELGVLRASEERLGEELALARRHRRELDAALEELRHRLITLEEHNAAVSSELEATRRALEESERAAFALESAAAVERRDLFFEWRRREQLEARLAAAEDRGGEELTRLREELQAQLEQERQLRAEGERRRLETAAAHELEVDVRAGELAFALEELERLEGQLWSASDEASRHAARVAAAAASAENERQAQRRLAELRGELEAEILALRGRVGRHREDAAAATAVQEELWWRGERWRGEAQRAKAAHEAAAHRWRAQAASGEAQRDELWWQLQRRRGAVEALEARLAALGGELRDAEGRDEAHGRLLARVEQRLAEEGAKGAERARERDEARKAHAQALDEAQVAQEEMQAAHAQALAEVQASHEETRASLAEELAETQTALEASRQQAKTRALQLARVNERLGEQQRAGDELKQLKQALREANTRREQEQRHSDQLTDKVGELQELLLGARRELAEDRRRWQLDQQRLEQQVAESEAARSRAVARLEHEARGRRQAERELNRRATSKESVDEALPGAWDDDAPPKAPTELLEELAAELESKTSEVLVVNVETRPRSSGEHEE